MPVDYRSHAGISSFLIVIFIKKVFWGCAGLFGLTLVTL